MDSFVEQVRQNEPGRLPPHPVIGDRVCCRWNGDPKIYVCRVVKGKKGNKMHVVPAIKGEGLYDEPFDPAVDDWSWPTPIMMSALEHTTAVISSGSGGCTGKTSTTSSEAKCSSRKKSSGDNSGMSEQEKQIEILKMQIALLEPQSQTTLACVACALLKACSKLKNQKRARQVFVFFLATAKLATWRPPRDE